MTKMKTVVIAAFVLLVGGCASTPAEQPEKLPIGAISVSLNNASFAADSQGRLTGWNAFEHNQGKSYSFVADPNHAYSAPTSLRIQRYGPETFGLMQQVIRLSPETRGKFKTARLTGYLRAADVSGTGALVIQARRADNSVISHDHMDRGRVTGSQVWKRYVVEVELAADANDIAVGVMLEDGGTLWADDLALTLMPN